MDRRWNFKKPRQSHCGSPSALNCGLEERGDWTNQSWQLADILLKEKVAKLYCSEFLNWRINLAQEQMGINCTWIYLTWKLEDSDIRAVSFWNSCSVEVVGARRDQLALGQSLITLWKELCNVATCDSIKMDSSPPVHMQVQAW